MRPSSRMRHRALSFRTWGGSSRAMMLSVEPLESRTLLSASSVLDGLFASPLGYNPAQVTNTIPTGYTPSQIRSAYGFDKISFSNGAVQGDGSGQTIAIVDAYNDPNISSDLQVFDKKFGIADPPSFTKVNQTGGTALPQSDSGWSEEIALDVEWAHAIAPKANILLVEASSNSINNLLQAVDTARSWSGVSVVSMSWGGGEFSGETAADQHFTTPSGHTGVTFLASAGDNGASPVAGHLAQRRHRRRHDAQRLPMATTAASRPGAAAAADRAALNPNLRIKRPCKAAAGAPDPTWPSTPTPTPVLPSTTA